MNGRQGGNTAVGQGYGQQMQSYGAQHTMSSENYGGMPSGYAPPQPMWSTGTYLPQQYPFQQPLYSNLSSSQQQYLQPQSFYSHHSHQVYPSQPSLNTQSQTRPPPVYPQSTPHPPPLAPPQQNAQGYTLSATAFSLPSHHYKPSTPDQPEMSEDELRYLLEQQMKNLKPGYPPPLGPLTLPLLDVINSSIPIEGTNVKLVSVEDVMEWRETRRKRWLSKIAAVVNYPSRVGG